MADLSSLLAALELDPDDVQALEGLVPAARVAPAADRAGLLAAARKALAARGRPDIVVHLFDVELAALDGVTGAAERRLDLLLEKGMVLDTDLLDVAGARAAFGEVLRARPDDQMAREALEELDLAAGNWQKFADKYLSEARGSTDRSLATGLYMSAAEAYVRHAPDPRAAEPHLLKALEVEPRNAMAAFHLARLYQRAQRWPELAALYEARAAAGAPAERIAALIALAQLLRGPFANAPDAAARAEGVIRQVLALDPGQPQALRATGDALAAAGNWKELVAVYGAALRARKDDDLGLLLQVAMILWRHLRELDQAEQYFARIRKLEPAHPAALDFYREYFPAKNEPQKLLALLKSVPASGGAGVPEAVVDPASGGAPNANKSRPLSMEIAVLSEQQNNPEKAIEAWKQHLRQDPSSREAREALARLYRKTEKWNALLDLMKDEVERLPESDVAGRVARLLEVVEIYRDKLRLDVMVVNTYNAILKIDPDNRRATDELAAKFRALSRWNDLIAVLARKSELADVPRPERIALLREVADLWAERFGNFANAIKPLERILELDPLDADAIARLKDIYTRRRQWRALIDVLGREAGALAGGERRAKQLEMARLAAERLGDTRLAIEIANTVLGETPAAEQGEILATLAGLYDREKRYLALAEILHRQAAATTGKDAVALHERLGQIYADRLAAPQLAAEQWQQVLEIEPHHARALRTLRELYATAGDFAGLERLYNRLGQQDELVEALLAIADRLDAKDKRLPLVERAAQLAQERADRAAAQPPEHRKTESGKTDAQALERARQVWERVLAVEPTHVGAATALVPIYTKQEKWARLLTMHELELAAQPTPEARLTKVAQIRQLCEHKLASRTLAFAWTVRAFDLDPESPALFDDVLRLAGEPDQWSEAAAAFERALAGDARPVEVRLRLLRELARIAARRLADPERARTYHRAVLALAPDDRAAEQALEELAIQLHDWPELLASYRRRAAREKDATERASLLIEIASLQEEKLHDLDGAAATYKEALAALPGQVRALRALARIEEARGDWESLASVHAQELAQTTDANARFALLMKLGELEEKSLERPSAALAHYRDALAIPANGAVRPQAVAALSRIGLDPATKIADDERVATARLIAPHHESARQTVEHASALEVIRAGAAPAEQLELDRALVRIYHGELGDPAAAWRAGLRVLAAEPTDADTRVALGALAGQLGRDGEWARELEGALARVKQTAGHAPADVRAIATELARLAGERLGDRAMAEKAWLAVLVVEADAADAFDALIAMYRADARWGDLRALLERRAEVTLDDRVRLASLLELAALEDDVLGQPGAAAAAHRRVLELDPAYTASYQALDRLYTGGHQYKELEELLARWTSHVAAKELVGLQYRRAELFAHHLNEPERAVDLVEDILARQRAHADARELLEEMLPQRDAAGKLVIGSPERVARVARLLEPLYEQDKLWKDLVGVLRVQRELVGGTEAVELLSRIAAIEESELSGARNAFEAWLAVLGLDPTHERARLDLVRLAEPLGRWPEAIAALEAAVTAAPAGDIATRAALLDKLAAYYDVGAGDVPHAIATYKRLIDTDPSPATLRRAGGALARLYEETEAWAELRDITRKQAEWADDPAERRSLLAQVAGLEEDRLHDVRAAINTWRDVVADNPGDAGGLAALERLYEGSERWRDLVEVLRRKLEHMIASAPNTYAIADAGKALLARIAALHETRLGEPEEAIAAYLETLELQEAEAHGVDAHDARALVELARLYRASQRHADLLDILERQAAPLPAGEPTRLRLDAEIAQLLAGPLGRGADALDRWAQLLQAAPTDEGALAAVEQATSDLDLRYRAAEILEPVYEATGRHDRLAALLGRVASWADDPGTKLRALGRVVRIHEHALGDKAAAFATQLQALGHAAAEPELAQTIAETERLAGELGRESDLIDAYREIAPNVLDAELQRRLYLDVADLARAVRRDLELARTYYQKVLETQPDDRRALVALESIYRDTNDGERLVEVLLRQADIAGADIDDRVGALVEAAGLYVEAKRFDDAIATWEQVLAIAPERKDAVAALEQLYRDQGRWPDVVDLYERRLGFATSVEEAVALRVQLGEIHEVHLRDLETAIDNYEAALSGNPSHPAALAAVERYLHDPDVRTVAAEVLEPIYVSQHRWVDLIRVYKAKLEGTTDVRERLKLTRFLARLHEEQLEDLEHASEWYAKLFREAPSDASVRDQLHRLASVIDNWAFVAQAYQGYLDDEAGDSNDVRDVAIAAATIYDRRLGQFEPAYKAYRRALAIEADAPITESTVVVLDEREVLARLEDLCARAQRPAELVQIYDDVVGRASDELRRDALVKRARLVERGLGDTAKAIEGWREVVLATEDATAPGDEAAYREAVVELERLYRTRGTAGEEHRWLELVDSLEARLARALARDQYAEAAELRLRLADVHEHQRHDLPAALDRYAELLDGFGDGDERQFPGWQAAVSSLERLVVHEEHRERIAGLLEPVYRKQDWWQRLVVILDAKLAYIRDPLDQVATLHEIAQIHETRDGALDLALAALARAWRLDVADEASLGKLLALAGKLDAWDDVVQTLEAGAPSTSDPELAASLWARAAQIHEQHRHDPASAIRAWREVDKARPDDLVALAALDRLLALERRPEELVVVIARRAELTEDAGVRLVLYHRVATLHEEVLHDRPAAIATYRNVLGVDDTDGEALDALERLYRETGDARELAQILERKIELATDATARRALRHAAATVYETQLADVYQAIGQLVAILDDDAADAVALEALDRIYAAQKMHPELLDVVDRRALLATSAIARAELAFRAAHLVETELADPDAAIPRYGAVLEIHAPHAGARDRLEALTARDEHVGEVTPILERVYRTDRDAAGLVRVYERRLALRVDDPALRVADWNALAEVHETIAGRPNDAFAVRARAIVEDPEDPDRLAPLDRLAHTQGMWAELAGLLDRLLGMPGAVRADVTLSPDSEQRYAMRLGQVAEDKLADLDRAAAAFERATHGADPRPGLAALERVLARSGRWGDLAGVLRRQADASERDDQTVEYLFRLGDLQESTLADPRAAIAAYREVLGIAAEHAPTRQALERMLAAATREGGDARAPEITEIVEVLEPLFEQDGDAARLAMVLESRVGITADAIDRAGLLARIVELAEDRLGDLARALDAALRWLAVEPSSHQALAVIDRLAERLARWPEVAQRVDAIVHTPDARTRDPEVQGALLGFLGSIQRERLGDLEGAAASYRGALALEPAGSESALAALDPLIAILRQLGRDAELADALRQRGKVAGDPSEQRAAWAEVGAIAERLGDRAGAIAAWREIADDHGDDRDALDQLARIYRTTAATSADDRHELIELLGRAARLASDPADEKRVRVEIAQLEAETPRAIGAWQAVLDLDPDDAAALAALEAAHARAADWAAVADVQGRRLALAKSDAARIAIHAEMARLAETKRDAVDDALASWFAVLDLDNSHLPAYRELERLLTGAQRWHDLVDLSEREAELAAVRGDGARELELLARCADIWEGKLDNPDAAGEILEKILAREPSSVAALTRLSKIYERGGDWDKCKATLEKALAQSPSGRDAADLFYRLGEVARAGDHDLDTAQNHLAQALKHDPGHAQAIAALEKIARERGNAALLADMLQRRAATIAAPAERVAVYVELAELERKAGHDEAALAALARAATDAPNDARVLGPLADLYFQVGRLDEAAPIYDRLADEAKAARRMKDVARFRQRQGGILEKRGDTAGALAAYDEALRVNPTDVTTMCGLGRLYIAAKEWEKARRIYQSLVLQNIDADAGITKAEVYLALGDVLVQLGQAPKAKSMYQRGLELEPSHPRLKEALAAVATAT